MSKVRIYELAKEHNMSSKKMLDFLKREFGLEFKSHMSVLEGENLELIREYFDSLKEEEEKPLKKSKEKEDRKKKKQQNKGQKPEKTKESKKKDKQKKDQKPEFLLLGEQIVVKDFAEQMKVPVTQIIMDLMKQGVMAAQNQFITFDQASQVAKGYGVEILMEEEEEEQTELEALDYEDDEKDLRPRPPVITVMGHVDHGKTSILDAIRETAVTKSEAGGITQHIGASTATVNGKKITFLDTPGHEAFTQMRMRGAQTTDIVILVVAADDGVMPQTIEAIAHAKAAKVPIVVAINKMDKYEADPSRVQRELMEQGLVPEEWGGDTIMVPVSAHTKQGIEELLEMVLMVAEMEELKANPNRPAVGTIIEAKLDKGRGPVATVLVQKGTLRTGDFVITGTASGRVRAMFDSRGKKVNQVKPSFPALILGLSEVPEAGDKIYVVKDEKQGRALAEKQKELAKEEQFARASSVKLDTLFSQIEEGETKELNIIIKTDVKGTIDAVRSSLEKLSNDEVKVNCIHGAVGGITESDVMLAAASQAVIIGFNVRPNQGAMEQAKIDDIDIHTYRVIYDAIEDVKNAIQGMLSPKYKEEILGRCEVRQVFKVPGVGNVAGVYVTTGKITRTAKVRLLRDNIVIHEGEISSLKRFKDDVRELPTGYEGGVGIDKYNDIKQGDVLEAYQMVEVKRK